MKRKEQKDEIWREVFRELNKPDAATMEEEAVAVDMGLLEQSRKRILFC
ncbi:MAG: hypothetical protein IJA67_07810 [Oscillospiraceae bacterium]|nr:hypothetical protein [Oscillospiraceae bacterium]